MEPARAPWHRKRPVDRLTGAQRAELKAMGISPDEFDALHEAAMDMHAAEELGALIQDATAQVNLARHEWQREGTEAAWNWLQARVCYRDGLLREARARGLSREPVLDEPARFRSPGRMLAAVGAMGAAVVFAWRWGGPGLRGLAILLALAAAAGWWVSNRG